MAYLGKSPTEVFRAFSVKDTFTGDGSTLVFTLSRAAFVGSPNDVQVFVDNVRQEPGSGKSYTIELDGSNNATQLTFTAAPEAASEIYVIISAEPTTVIVPADGSVTTAKIAADAVDGTKLADDAVDSEHITDGSVDNVHLAGSIENAKLSNSSITINGTSISLGGSGNIVAGTDWQSVITADGSTVTTAVASEGYFIDTTSAAHTINLPLSATLGDEVSIVDYSGTADTNNITVGRNGHKIQGDTSDLTISTERAALTLVYTDASQGWLLKDK